MTVGDTIYKFDPNRRKYVAGDSAPVYREHWEPVTIDGETSRSWLVGKGWAEIKVSKASLKASDSRGGFIRFLPNLDMVERDCWVHENRHKLSAAVDHCNDYEKLLRIEKILGETL